MRIYILKFVTRMVPFPGRIVIDDAEVEFKEGTPVGALSKRFGALKRNQFTLDRGEALTLARNILLKRASQVSAKTAEILRARASLGEAIIQPRLATIG